MLRKLLCNWGRELRETGTPRDEGEVSSVIWGWIQRGSSSMDYFNTHGCYRHHFLETMTSLPGNMQQASIYVVSPWLTLPHIETDGRYWFSIARMISKCLLLKEVVQAKVPYDIKAFYELRLMDDEYYHSNGYIAYRTEEANKSVLFHFHGNHSKCSISFPWQPLTVFNFISMATT